MMNDTKNWWAKKVNRLTLGEVQSIIGQLSLGKLNMEVNTQILGEVTFSYVPPKIAQLKLKKNLQEFKDYIKRNKPDNLTIHYREVT